MNEQKKYGKNRTVVQFLAFTGFILAMIAAVAAALSGFGSRWEWWNFSIGFLILRWAAYAGLSASALSFFASIVTRGEELKRLFIISVAGIVVGLIVAGIPWSWLRTAQRVPCIHDITTDTENPPQFVTVLPLRKNAPNSVVYAGQRIAEQQRAAYPDIVPLILRISTAQAFERAVIVARRMGWLIVEANPAEGRIEATATTFWFGFKDDVVIRIVPVPAGSRLDVRSVSRVGQCDVGTNAARIRSYLKKFEGTP